MTFILHVVARTICSCYLVFILRFYMKISTYKTCSAFLLPQYEVVEMIFMDLGLKQQ